MKHSTVHHKDTCLPSPQTKDSRPRPLVIPGRRSDVRLLIDFFNTRAFKKEEGLSTPRTRQLPDPIPENKVKSLVVNFNRLETFSSPTTLASSPTVARTTQWQRRRTSSMPEKPEPQTGKQVSIQFGKQLNIKPTAIVGGDVEEITVSGGDRREMTYKKSQEPLRSVKVWKEGSVRSRSRNSKALVDGPTILLNEVAESFSTTETPPRVKRRKQRRRTPGDGSERYYSSNRSDSPSPIRGEKMEQRTRQQPRRAMQAPEPRRPKSPSPPRKPRTSAPLRRLKSPILPPSPRRASSPAIPRRIKSPALPPQLPLMPTYPTQAKDSKVRVTAREPTRTKKSDEGVTTRPNTTAGGKPALKYSASGTVKGTLMTVFGETSRQDDPKRKGRVSTNEPAPISKGGVRSKNDKSERRRVLAKYEPSQATSSGSERNSPEPVKGPKPPRRRKPHVIIMTEATPTSPTLPDIDSVVKEIENEEASALGNPQVSGFLKYPASTLRQPPRTFKDIALKRREERQKAALVLPPIEDPDLLSVPPLRVIKAQDPDPDVPTLQNPVPLRRLYSKASQETLTSFEEPSIHVSDSSSVLEEELDDVELDVEHPQETEPLRFSLTEDLIRPPLRSPTLMREMAPPRLTLRTPATQARSKKQLPQPPAVTQQNSTPRMKLLKDDEWRERPQQRLRTNLIDGPNDVWSQRRHPRSVSSTSHDSSKIAAERLDIQPLQLQPELQSSGGEEGEEGEGEGLHDGDDKLMMQSQRTRVNFSTYTQNFPAVECTTGDDEQQRIGDRTTAFDGVEEVTKVSGTSTSIRVRMKGDGIRRRIQKFEEQRFGSGGGKKKAYRDRPKILG